jgi:hypothetical protein
VGFSSLVRFALATFFGDRFTKYGCDSSCATTPNQGFG